MTVTKRKPTLGVERAYTDKAIASNHGADLYGATNEDWERITDVAAPGSSRTARGHIHDGNGDGRGIPRNVIGGFYTVSESGPPLTLNTSATDPGESMATGYSSLYESGAGSVYVLGVAYVSPGITSIKVEFCAKHDTSARTVSMRVKNITDGTDAASWQTLTTSANWYTSAAIAVTSPNDGTVKRVELDIWVKVDASSDDVSLYHAYPFEDTKQT